MEPEFFLGGSGSVVLTPNFSDIRTLIKCGMDSIWQLDFPKIP